MSPIFSGLPVAGAGSLINLGFITLATNLSPDTSNKIVLSLLAASLVCASDTKLKKSIADPDELTITTLP